MSTVTELLTVDGADLGGREIGHGRVTSTSVMGCSRDVDDVTRSTWWSALPLFDNSIESHSNKLHLLYCRMYS